MVVTPERTLFVGCESADGYVEWIRALRNLMKNEQQRLAAVVRATLVVPHSVASAVVSSTHSSVNPSRQHELPAITVANASRPDPRRASFLDRVSGVLDSVPENGSAEFPVGARTGDSTAVAAPAPAGNDPPSYLRSGEHHAAIAAAITPRVGDARETESHRDTREDAVKAAPAPTVPPAASSAQNWEIQLDDVELEERIGAGAFGEVYRGRLWGTDVAVKRLVSASLTPEVLENLKAEVSVLSQLRHPNVVLYLGACTAPPDVCIVTEWAEHGSLHEQLYDRTVPMSAVNRLGLALQTAQGMCYLHAPRHMIIHRDLKSHNLLLTRDYTVKVADFGLTIRRSMQPAAADTESAGGAGVAQSDGDGGSVAGVPVGRPPRLSGLGTVLTQKETETPARRASNAANDSEARTGLGGDSNAKDRARRPSVLGGDSDGGLLAHLQRAAAEGTAGGAAPEAGQFYGIQGTPQWMVSARWRWLYG